MPLLENPWIRYMDRTYQQIKDRVLTSLSVLVPEMTDHTESNLYVKMLGIWSGIAEMVGYYIDNAARETHLSSARLYWTAVKIAGSYSYRISASLSATGEVTFGIGTPILVDATIPQGTELESIAGVLYYTTESLTILAGDTEGTVSVAQYKPIASYSLGTSSGLPSQTFELEEDVANGSIVIKVAGVVWESVESLGLYGADSEVFYQTVNEAGIPVVVFGDDRNGKIPPSGAALDIAYNTTVGEAGNSGSNTITTINGFSIPSVTLLTVTNIERISGGSGVETLAQLKRRIPLANRTLMRAVTPQDFIDVAELNNGVAKASLEHECGDPANIFIVPEGGGIASPSLIASTQVWLGYRKTIGIEVIVQSAGEIHIKFVIDVRVKPRYDKITVANATRAALADFMSFKHQNIGGFVQLSDVYEVVENVEGVEYSSITLMSPIPYARPIDDTSTILNWTKSLGASNVSNARWTISFISTALYELFMGDIMLGVHSVGDTLTFPEIVFKVEAGTYIIGDKWEFHTYPYFGTIYLDEPSLPVSTLSDITLTTSGGI